MKLHPCGWRGSALDEAEGDRIDNLAFTAIGQSVNYTSELCPVEEERSRKRVMPREKRRGDAARGAPLEFIRCQSAPSKLGFADRTGVQADTFHKTAQTITERRARCQEVRQPTLRRVGGFSVFGLPVWALRGIMSVPCGCVAAPGRLAAARHGRPSWAPWLTRVGISISASTVIPAFAGTQRDGALIQSRFSICLPLSRAPRV